MNMVRNSLTGQFQPKLFYDSKSCHGIAFVKQNIGVGHQIFLIAPYYSFVAVKYDGSNMSGMTAANTFKGS